MIYIIYIIYTYNLYVYYVALLCDVMKQLFPGARTMVSAFALLGSKTTSRFKDRATT